MPVIWHSLRRLFQKIVEGFDCKISGRALGAAVRHSFGWSDGQAQTQSVSESAAFNAGRDSLAWGKRVATLAILTHCQSQKGLNVNFGQLRVTFFSCEMKFSMELARFCCRTKQRPLLCSIFRSVIGLWVKYDARDKTACSESNPVKSRRSKILNWRPVRGKGVCSYLNRTAQWLQMAARKSLETMSGVILNRLQPKFAAKSVANELLCLKAMQWPALTGRASIFDLKIFWAICVCKQSSTVLLTNHP